MNNHGTQLTMWESGWALGKYDQIDALPQNTSDAKKWLEGFTVGNIQVCLYEKIHERLSLLLADYPRTYQLVNAVINNNKEIHHVR